MQHKVTYTITSPYGEKYMHVYQGDIKDLTEPVDLLSLSAFEYNYSPNPVTIIGAIYDQYDISVKSLSESPLMDMRSLCSCWISDAIAQTPKNPYIRRIGCVEFQPLIRVKDASAETLLSRIQSYYQMLDLLPLNGVPLHNIIMPVLGAGNQSIDPGLTIVPIINEAIQYLKRSPFTDSITFLDRSSEKVTLIQDALNRSYSLLKENGTLASAKVPSKSFVFISYASGDKRIADLLCQKLEEKNIKTWYAPRDIKYGNYAKNIVDAIANSTHFITVISQNSMESEHVLNEIDLAFEHLKSGLVIIPFRIDTKDLRAEFNYYLKRQQWVDAQTPPLERRIDEMISRVFGC